jgi:hypothetical protein
MEAEPRSSRIGTIAIAIALCALAYPLLAIAFAQLYAAMASRDISPKTEAYLLLLVFPVTLCCALSFVLALKSQRKKRALGLSFSVLAGILNIVFFFAASVTY